MRFWAKSPGANGLIEDLQYMLLGYDSFFFRYLHPQPSLTIFKVL